MDTKGHTNGIASTALDVIGVKHILLTDLESNYKLHFIDTPLHLVRKLLRYLIIAGDMQATISCRLFLAFLLTLLVDLGSAVPVGLFSAATSSMAFNTLKDITKKSKNKE